MSSAVVLAGGRSRVWLPAGRLDVTCRSTVTPSTTNGDEPRDVHELCSHYGVSAEGATYKQVLVWGGDARLPTDIVAPLLVNRDSCQGVGVSVANTWPQSRSP